MTFRTILPSTPSLLRLGHEDCILAIGSCFTENIGAYLEKAKFKIAINPFGIVYNPISMADTLFYLLNNKDFEVEKNIFEHQGIWSSFLHHSSFSALTKEGIIEKIQGELIKSQAFFSKTNRLLITFGSATVYENKESTQIVANCHKLPAHTFIKRRLSIEEITATYGRLLTELQANNPSLEIIFTVSPIRHIRDGLVENQRSKATLLLAIDALCARFERVHYFPAYELLLDDLRDYRFFENDLIHPTAFATQYIWEYFSETYFNSTTKEIIEALKKIYMAAAHRPFQPDSAAHQNFLEIHQENIEIFNAKYPFLIAK
ncbi:MAG: hypothetical protein RLZZ292_3065 [Bacteroidota bacterium]|jgi:hypothetical protein